MDELRAWCNAAVPVRLEPRINDRGKWGVITIYRCPECGADVRRRCGLFGHMEKAHPALLKPGAALPAPAPAPPPIVVNPTEGEISGDANEPLRCKGRII